MTKLPIEIPGKIIAIGLNYGDHAKESGNAIPERPVMFAKFPSSLIATGEPICLPAGSLEVDYEAELAVVIGRSATGVRIENALDYVSGYTCLNDVTDRTAQFADGQWVRGKSFDTFAPVGPRVVPAAEIGDPQALAVKCWVNDDLVQDGNTADMIFGVAELITYITATITLEPGDIITTGTPAGVGIFRDPQLFLKPGDEVTVEVERIGRLTNPVTAKTPS